MHCSKSLIRGWRVSCAISLWGLKGCVGLLLEQLVTWLDYIMAVESKYVTLAAAEAEG